MKTLLLIACLALLTIAPTQNKTQIRGLPAGALIVETRPLNAEGRADRALVLWMLRPSKNPRATPDDQYTCPEETRGHYYSGPTRVSLIDTAARRVINTVKITPDAEQDSFDVPYRIHEGSYYRVPGVAGGREGRPAIMWLRDYNGDGKASEFVLFDAQACTGLQTTLVGYSASQDKVIQYPVELQVINGDNRAIEVRQWVDYLFSKTPAGPGRWKYEIDYRGRGGTLDRYEVRYDRRAEKFVGKAEELGDEPGARPED